VARQELLRAARCQAPAVRKHFLSALLTMKPFEPVAPEATAAAAAEGSAAAGETTATVPGSLIIQALWKLDAEDLAPLVESIVALPVDGFVTLSKTFPGSRALEGFFASPGAGLPAKQRVLRRLNGHYAEVRFATRPPLVCHARLTPPPPLQLAVDKYGSHVVDAAWKTSDLNQKVRRRTRARHMLKSINTERLRRDGHGHDRPPSRASSPTAKRGWPPRFTARWPCATATSTSSSASGPTGPRRRSHRSARPTCLRTCSMPTHHRLPRYHHDAKRTASTVSDARGVTQRGKATVAAEDVDEIETLFAAAAPKRKTPAPPLPAVAPATPTLPDAASEDLADVLHAIAASKPAAKAKKSDKRRK
jgi:hypothetical protein